MLVDAVAASCAVPCVWPPVTIGGHRYMDGGVRSGTNADLAVGHDVVVVITPEIAEMDAPLDGRWPSSKREGSAVEVVRTDAEAACRDMGPNALDPAMRARPWPPAGGRGRVRPIGCEPCGGPGRPERIGAREPPVGPRRPAGVGGAVVR